MQLDTSTELMVKRCQQGVKFVKPNDQIVYPRVGELLDMPFCIYINNQDSAMQSLNVPCMNATGYHSINDSIGKTPHDFFCAQTAHHHIKNQQNIMISQSFDISEEDVFRVRDEVALNIVSAIFPIINDDEESVGVFGCSIIIGEYKISDFFRYLSKLGLLNQPLSRISIVDHLYTKRERECLDFILQGYKTKDIAAKLNLSRRTVEHYIESMKNKVGASSKSDLILKATQQSVII